MMKKYALILLLILSLIFSCTGCKSNSEETSINDEKNACADFKKAGDLGYFDAYEMIKKYCDNKKKTKTIKK